MNKIPKIKSRKGSFLGDKDPNERLFSLPLPLTRQVMFEERNEKFKQLESSRLFVSFFLRHARKDYLWFTRFEDSPIYLD